MIDIPLSMLGKIVKVHILDHTENHRGGKIVSVCVYGKVIDIQDDHIKVIVWESDDEIDNGKTVFGIVRGAITEIYELIHRGRVQIQKFKARIIEDEGSE